MPTFAGKNQMRHGTHFTGLLREASRPGSHPIIAVMFPGEDGARQATAVAAEMLHQGVYVTAFSFPVVPKGEARIRVQISAAHSEGDVRAAVAAFVNAWETVGSVRI